MHCKKLITHCRITCEHSESAREWRIALYKQSSINQSCVGMFVCLHAHAEHYNNGKVVWGGLTAEYVMVYVADEEMNT